MESKKEVRKRVKSLVKAMASDTRAVEASAVAEQLLHHPKVQSAATIALFASLPDEIDTTQLIEALATKTSVVLPRLLGDEMDFYPYSANAMHSGAMGILEPDGDVPVAPQDIDVMILPGLAFTPDGLRLGRGKGYYDKYMSRERYRAYTIGICHIVQLLDTLPVEPHDKCLDEVVTSAYIEKNKLKLIETI